MNLSAVAWVTAVVLIVAAAALRTARRHREQAAWQKWMRDTDMALDTANGPSRDFAEWEHSMTGGDR